MIRDNGYARLASSRMTVITLTVLFLSGPGMASSSSPGWEQSEKLWNPSDGEQFGNVLAADGETLAVRGNGVNLFEPTRQGDWGLVQSLAVPENPFADDGPWGTANGQGFGMALGVDAEAGVLAVGAPGFDVTGNVSHHETDAGAVYIYERTPQGEWNRTARFVGPVNTDFGEQSSPRLGSSIAVDGPVVAAGAPTAERNGESRRGEVHVFERARDGSWSQVARLASPVPWADAWDEYGSGLAVAEGRLAVGAPGETSGTGENGGAVHVYRQGAEDWWHASRLTPGMLYSPFLQAQFTRAAAQDIPSSEAFGSAVAFDEDASTLAVGAPLSNRAAGLAPPTSTDADLKVCVLDCASSHPWGTAYVFDRTAGTWSHTASLENPDREAQSGFGTDLAVDEMGQMLVVGARLANQSEKAPARVLGKGVEAPVSDQGLVTHHPGSGAAYVFDRRAGWDCTARLSGDDTNVEEGFIGGDRFGAAVGFAGSNAWAGAAKNGAEDSGTVYGFQAPSQSNSRSPVRVPYGCVTEPSVP